MKPRTIVACAGLAVPVLAGAPALAGDLNPPPGVIAPTMKPLDAIAPGQDVNRLPGDSAATHVISSPGLYTFSADVVGEDKKDGLRIDCDAFGPGEHTVAISMQGFSLTGVQGAANAILVSNSSPNTCRVHVVISGSIDGVPDGAVSRISGWSVDGVHVDGATSCVVTGLRVSDCLGDAFECASPPASGAEVRCVRCVFSSSGGDGITVTLPSSGPSSLEIQEVQCLHNTNNGARISYTGGQGASPKSRCRMRNVVFAENTENGLRITGVGDESISYSFDVYEFSSNGGDGARLSVDRSQSADFVARFHNGSSSGDAGNGVSFTAVTAAPGTRHSISWDACVSSRNGADGFACDVSSCPQGSTHRFAWNACTAVDNNFGFHLTGAAAADVRCALDRCSATRNRLDGHRQQSADSRMQSCDFSSNAGSGVSSTNCAIRCSSTTCSSNALYALDIRDLGDSRDDSIDNLRASNNASGGVIVVGGATLTMSRCVCVGNGGGGGGGGAGIDISSVLVSSLRDLSCHQNFTHGLVVSDSGAVSIRRASMDANGRGPVGGDGTRLSRDQSADIADLRCTNNTGNGLTLSSLTGDASLEGLRCSSNTGDGCYVSDFGLSRIVAADRCVCSSNGGNGFSCSSALGLGCGQASFRRCVASSNTGDGFHLDATTGGEVRRCSSSGNGGTGILVAGNNHVVVENTCASNTGGAIVCPVPGNTLGPMVDEAGVSTNCNPAANYVR